MTFPKPQAVVMENSSVAVQSRGDGERGNHDHRWAAGAVFRATELPGPDYGGAYRNLCKYENP